MIFKVLIKVIFFLKCYIFNLNRNEFLNSRERIYICEYVEFDILICRNMEMIEYFYI